MSNLVSFRGGIGAGKSTAATRLVHEHGFTKIAFADPLKTEIFDALWAGRHEGIARYISHYLDESTGYEDFWSTYSRPDEAFRPLDLYYISRDQKIAWVNANKVKLRPLLQWWGTEYRRGQDENYWVNQWHDIVVDNLSRGYRVVVDDARFDNEIDLILRLGGVHLFIAADSRTRAERLEERDGEVNLGIMEHASESLAKHDDPRNATIINNDCSQELFFQQIDGAVYA